MELGNEYQIITISFNTKDTPEKAAIKKNNFVTKIGEENQKHWIYLTGEQDNILKITESVGFKYMPQGLDFAPMRKVPPGTMEITAIGRM